MKVDITPFEVWENLNALAGPLVNAPADCVVRCYQGLALATFELAMATVQFYSHKRSVAMCQGMTPHFQSVLPYLYKEGYEVQIAPEALDAKAWVEGLKKDTLFVLLAEDHAVTGELFDHAELEKLLNEKKIFCFKISHQNHFFRKTDSVMPYSARICGFDPATAVAMVGGKLKAPNLISGALSWEPEAFIKRLESAVHKAVEKRETVEKFEQGLPSGFKALLQTKSRTWDRALIYSEDIAGESLQQYLAGALGLQIGKPGFETLIETTHLCRWGGTTNYDGWWKPRPTESILRGLLLLAPEILDHPGLRAALEKAPQACSLVI
jgi:hypothetical protein